MDHEDLYGQQQDLEDRLKQTGIRHDRIWTGSFSDLLWLYHLTTEEAALALELIRIGLNGHGAWVTNFNQVASTVRECLVSPYELWQVDDGVQIRFVNGRVLLLREALEPVVRHFFTDLRSRSTSLIRGSVDDSLDGDVRHLT